MLDFIESKIHCRGNCCKLKIVKKEMGNFPDLRVLKLSLGFKKAFLKLCNFCNFNHLSFQSFKISIY